MRLIDADVLLTWFNNHYDHEEVTVGYVSGLIKEQSTIDAVPVRHGKWLDREVVDDRKDAKIQQWQQARCSCCNKWHTTPYMYYFENYDYCPHCGAKMDAEREEE